MAVVKVVIPGSGGSGVCVAYDGDAHRAAILTCKHVVSRPTQGMKVFFPKGSVYLADFWVASASRDLSLLIIYPGQPVPCVPVSTIHPIKDMEIYQVGWPNGRFTERAGTVKGYTGTKGTFRHCMTSFDVMPGDSGSPIFLKSDRALCGIVWGSEVRYVGARSGPGIAVELGDVQTFLAQVGWPESVTWPKPGSKPGTPPKYDPIFPELPDKQALREIVRKIEELAAGLRKTEDGMLGLKDGVSANGNGLLRLKEGLHSLHQGVEGTRPLLEHLRDAKPKLDALAVKIPEVLAAAEKFGGLASFLPLIIGGAATGGIYPLVVFGLWMFKRLRQPQGQGQGHESLILVDLIKKLLDARNQAPQFVPVQAGPAPMTMPMQTIVSQASPGPQVIRTEQHYVPVESPNLEAAALRQAMERLTRDNPGSINNVKAIEELAKIILSGWGKNQP